MNKLSPTITLNTKTQGNISHLGIQKQLAILSLTLQQHFLEEGKGSGSLPNLGRVGRATLGKSFNPACAWGWGGKGEPDCCGAGLELGGKRQSKEAGKRRAQSSLGFLSSMPTISQNHNH